MRDTLTSGWVVFTAKLVWLKDKCHGVGCTFITGVDTDVLRLWCVLLSFFSASEALSFYLAGNGERACCPKARLGMIDYYTHLQRLAFADFERG